MLTRSFFLLSLCVLTPAFASDVQKTYRILVTNDDGIEAPGLAALAAALKPLGEVVVVAPKTDQSGKSHSMTLLKGVPSVETVMHEGVRFGIAVDGTPADCVLTAIYGPQANGKFDIVVSGINYGTNVGVSSHYSGTVGAAVEGALASIPSIAFSQDSRRKEYSVSATIAAGIVARVLKEGLPQYTFLNVNIPEDPLQGVRVAPMGDGYYLLDRFETQGTATDGSTGLKAKLKRGTQFLPDRDTALYAQGYVTVAPLQADWTDENSVQRLRAWKLSLPDAAPASAP